MAESISVTLQSRAFDQTLRLAVSLLIAGILTAFLLWVLSAMILNAEPGMVSVAGDSSPGLITLQNDSNRLKYESPAGLPHQKDHVADSGLNSTLSDTLDEPTVVTSVQPPVIITTDKPESGFSLGVGEGANLPIVKVKPSREGYYIKHIELRKIDGYCIEQNPVPRVNAARDYRIMKGPCEIARRVKKSS